MIVIDASAMVEALVGRDADHDLLDSLQPSVHAPHLLDVEVLSVLRALTVIRKLPAPTTPATWRWPKRSTHPCTLATTRSPATATAQRLSPSHAPTDTPTRGGRVAPVTNTLDGSA